jgi:transcriptional regulator with XRE-family HTH domain
MCCQEAIQVPRVAAMTQTDWPAQVTARVAAAVRRFRRAKGMSAQELADACSDLGYEIPRNVIANLENGRRASVDLTEFLILAEALDVPPVLLLFPLGEVAVVEAFPGKEVATWEAASSFNGEWPGADPVPERYRVVEQYRRHRVAVGTALYSVQAVEDRRREAQLALGTEAYPDRAQAANHMGRLASLDLNHLSKTRADMQSQGMALPDLPEPLASLEAEGWPELPTLPL